MRKRRSGLTGQLPWMTGVLEKISVKSYKKGSEKEDWIE